MTPLAKGDPLLDLQMMNAIAWMDKIDDKATQECLTSILTILTLMTTEGDVNEVIRTAIETDLAEALGELQ